MMSKQEGNKEKIGGTTEAQKMLENKQADEAVVLLEEGVKCQDIEAMWMLGVCCEFVILQFCCKK